MNTIKRLAAAIFGSYSDVLAYKHGYLPLGGCQSCSASRFEAGVQPLPAADILHAVAIAHRWLRRRAAGNRT